MKDRKIHSLKFVLFLGFFVFSILGARTTEASTLYFSPSSGNFTVGNIFNVSLLVNTQGQAINNAEAVINFPTSFMEVTSISKFGSIFSLWVEEPNFSNSAGTISFNGGLPTPGFIGSSGKAINIVFRVKKAGSGSLISTSAAVRANDGYGTDVLTGTAQASFAFIAEEAPAPPATEKEVGGVPRAPVISSPTHPDSDKWYSEDEAVFTWPVGTDVIAAKLLVGQLAVVEPTVLYTPPISQKTIEDLDDGVWYFHVQLKNDNGWSTTSHFKFQVDTEQPDRFDIQLATREDLTERKVSFTFDAYDELSGIDHYEIRIDDRADQIWVDDGSGVYLTTPIPPGKHILIAKAVDKAGNFITNSVEFTVEQSPLFKFGFLTIEILSVVIPLLALLIFLFLLLLFGRRKYNDLKRRLRKEVGEAESALHKTFDMLKDDVQEQVKLLKKVKTKRELTEEDGKIIKQLKKDLDDAEKFVKKEIEDIDDVVK